MNQRFHVVLIKFSPSCWRDHVYIYPGHLSWHKQLPWHLIQTHFLSCPRYDHCCLCHSGVEGLLSLGVLYLGWTQGSSACWSSWPFQTATRGMTTLFRPCQLEKCCYLIWHVQFVRKWGHWRKTYTGLPKKHVRSHTHTHNEELWTLDTTKQINRWVSPFQYLSKKQQTLFLHFQVSEPQSLIQTAHQGLHT